MFLSILVLILSLTENEIHIWITVTTFRGLLRTFIAVSKVLAFDFSYTDSPSNSVLRTLQSIEKHWPYPFLTSRVPDCQQIPESSKCWFWVNAVQKSDYLQNHVISGDQFSDNPSRLLFTSNVEEMRKRWLHHFLVILRVLAVGEENPP